MIAQFKNQNMNNKSKNEVLKPLAEKVNKTDLVLQLIDKLRIESWLIVNELKSIHSENIREERYVKKNEFRRLKNVLNEIGEIINCFDNPNQIAFINLESRYLKGDFEHMGKTLETLIKEDDKYAVVIKQDWFNGIIEQLGRQIFYNEILYRYNKLKKDYPEDFILYKKELKRKQNVKKLKWNSNMSDLGFIFSILAQFDYYEFPKTKTRKPRKDTNFVADILLSVFEVESGGKGTLKEYLGDGEIKKEDKINSFQEAFRKALSVDSEEIFNLTNRSFFKK